MMVCKQHRWEAEDWWKKGDTVYLEYNPSELEVLRAVLSSNCLIKEVRVGFSVVGSLDPGLMVWSRPAVLVPGILVRAEIEVIIDKKGLVVLETEVSRPAAPTT